eukprot:381643_1
MPCLPVSEFWQRSFFKYYELEWIDSNSYHTSKSHSLLVTYNIPLIVIVSLILYGFVLVIPLSTHLTCDLYSLSQPITLYPPLYVVYEVLYTWLSYPCTVQILSIALPTTLQSKLCRYGLLPIPIFVAVTILYISYSPMSHINNSYIRTVGPFMQHWYLATVFLSTVCIQSMCKHLKRRHEHKRAPTMTLSSTDVYSVTGTKDHCSALASPITLAYELQTNLIEHNEHVATSDAMKPITDCVHHPLRQALFAILTTVGLTAVYYWCQFLTWKWKTHNNTTRHLWDDLKNGSIMFYYPVFWIVINVLRFLTTRCARYCDSNKYSKYSLELIMAFFFTCFYYVFYRNLFLHMGSYGYFALVKLMHVGLELLSYPVRMSRLYYTITDRLQNEYKEQQLMRVLYDPSSYRIWCIRICLDYSISLTVSVGSGMCYLVGVTWLRYGYNAYFYDLQNISDEQFTKTLVFTAISIGIELIVYVLIEYVMRYKYQMDVMKHWKALIRHRSGYIWYFIFMLQHVNTDVMIAKLQIY